MSIELQNIYFKNILDKTNEIDTSKSYNINFAPTKKQLEQYNNKSIYFFEKRLREGFKEKMKDPVGSDSKSRKGRAMRRYSYGGIIKELFGENYDQELYRKCLYGATKILAYYSTSIATGMYKKDGKKYSNVSCYVLSPARIRKCPPYSLKLRCEYFDEKGIEVNDDNMKLPKDNLKRGHARNYATEQVRKRMSEQGKINYEKYCKKQNS